ncbi:hypothetical protein PCORN_02491 [Listeria cornellensis FSL F6-0969]|uniref:Uncharacterized protein n=1 Tax=Listeria cornellensis FSL F6-0969 TaxID=1265820 RepID=W7C533_9LIST|nr:hypothetical protein PCORN_02491 [Listeria cornellensis FSL F6-0969]
MVVPIISPIAVLTSPPATPIPTSATDPLHFLHSLAVILLFYMLHAPNGDVEMMRFKIFFYKVTLHKDTFESVGVYDGRWQDVLLLSSKHQLNLLLISAFVL